MAEPRRSDVDVMLQVKGLNVYYGRSHALQGVDLTLEHGVLSVVGRNGMGKTTLCKTIMGLTRASSGSIRMRGEEMLGLPPAQIARHGVGYVPQGRRLWRSLTVDEHLRMTAARQRGGWTVERVYDTFPRLAERKNNGGAQLSGGEQQMLAISRALLTNPRLLIMDEPTEGLAPVIVSQVEEMLVRLGEESDMAILVIEQNIGVATTVSDNVAIMVNGRINRIIDSRRLAADRELQQRLLGVGRHSEAEPDRVAETAREARPLPRAPQGRRRRRSGFMSPTRRRRRGGRSRSPTRESKRARASLRPAGADRRGRGAAAAGAALRPSGRARRRHARHQGTGAALHPRSRRGERPAHAPGRRLDQRQARDLRRDGAGDRAQSWARRRGRVRPRARRLGDRHGRGVREPGSSARPISRGSSAPAARAAPRSSRRGCARCRSACRRC